MLVLPGRRLEISEQKLLRGVQQRSTRAIHHVDIVGKALGFRFAFRDHKHREKLRLLQERSDNVSLVYMRNACHKGRQRVMIVEILVEFFILGYLLSRVKKNIHRLFLRN